MADTLPGGAKIPVTFKAGEPLTENSLNTLQHELLSLILTHTHEGDEREAPQGMPLGPAGIQKAAIQSHHIDHGAITGEHIASGAIGADQLANGTIEGRHMAPGSVGAVQLAERAVTTAHIATGAVSSEQIAAHAVQFNHIAQGAVGALEIGDGVVGAKHLAERSVLTAHIGERVIQFNHIEKGAVDGDHISDGVIQANHIARGIIQGEHLTERSISGAHLKEGAIGSQELLSDAVLSAHIADRQITLSKLADGVIAQIKALLDATRSHTVQPGTGASSYAYCAYLDGSLAYRVGRGRHWWDFLLDRSEPFQAYPWLFQWNDGGHDRPMNDLLNTAPDIPDRRLIRNPGIPRPGMPIPIRSFDIDRQDLHLPPTSIGDRTILRLSLSPPDIGWEISIRQQNDFEPGIYGNAVFSERGESVLFQRGSLPSREQIETAARILYHYGIEPQMPLSQMLTLPCPRLYQFLNHPHLLGTGYVTGKLSYRNIRYVMRRSEGGSGFVRLLFHVPYADAAYHVTITPDYVPGRGKLYTPVVLRRTKQYLDLIFLDGSEQTDKANFSLSIHGELSAT